MPVSNQHHGPSEFSRQSALGHKRADEELDDFITSGEMRFSLSVHAAFASCQEETFQRLL
jgi:hypothetical protein